MEVIHHGTGTLPMNVELSVMAAGSVSMMKRLILPRMAEVEEK